MPNAKPATYLTAYRVPRFSVRGSKKTKNTTKGFLWPVAFLSTKALQYFAPKKSWSKKNKSREMIRVKGTPRELKRHIGCRSRPAVAVFPFVIIL
jgi:hypothetical protein